MCESVRVRVRYVRACLCVRLVIVCYVRVVGEATAAHAGEGFVRQVLHENDDALAGGVKGSEVAFRTPGWRGRDWGGGWQRNHDIWHTKSGAHLALPRCPLT